MDSKDNIAVVATLNLVDQATTDRTRPTVDPESQLAACKTALDQIARMCTERDATVLVNGQRMTTAKAIMLIAGWAQQGVTATEILLCT